MAKHDRIACEVTPMFDRNKERDTNYIVNISRIISKTVLIKNIFNSNYGTF